MQTQEIEGQTIGGWPVLVMVIVGAPLIVLAFIAAIANNAPLILLPAIPCLVVWLLLLVGFFTLQPNQAAVLVLFGKYKKSLKTSGFHWANPFLTKLRVSLRSRNLNMDTIKVNDSRGNPIEIAAVVVWHVKNTAQAVFDVDDFENYVCVQSEAALRHLASAHPYDLTEEEGQLSLRGDVDEVSLRLMVELQNRFAKAGVEVEEARLSHLAYAPEIAGAMLQRQQAAAIVAARSCIVEGAVGMVEMALDKLKEHSVVDLDEERKAAMVSNLLVVLCGQESAQPVVNAGTLYN